MKLVINELFNPTVQGEGSHAGQLVGFVRLANCNLACSWCDTPYSWDWKRFDKATEALEIETDHLAEIIWNWQRETGILRVVLTGGEPLMQQQGLVDLIDRVNAFTDGESVIEFDVETNGTIVPTPALVSKVAHFSVSPKLAHSGDIHKKRVKHDAIDTFVKLSLSAKPTVIFKFVCQTEFDVDEVTYWQREFEILESTIWIMPEGATKERHLETLEAIADKVVASRFNLTTRLHILAWGTKRGK